MSAAKAMSIWAPGPTCTAIKDDLLTAVLDLLDEKCFFHGDHLAYVEPQDDGRIMVVFNGETHHFRIKLEEVS